MSPHTKSCNKDLPNLRRCRYEDSLSQLLISMTVCVPDSEMYIIHMGVCDNPLTLVLQRFGNYGKKTTVYDMHI